MSNHLYPVPEACPDFPHFGDNFIFVLPVEHMEHTLHRPFCWDSACGCHEDPLLIAEVERWVQDGLMRPEEATAFIAGKGI